ncbi:hypothetical protein Agub_g14561, partial [Astrephomene gubernaculifera]
MSGQSYYELLGLSTIATDNEIRRAYRRLSLQWHPDKRKEVKPGADEIFRLIQEAYETLSCPEKRLLYDFAGAFAALADVTSIPSLSPISAAQARQKQQQQQHQQPTTAGAQAATFASFPRPSSWDDLSPSHLHAPSSNSLSASTLSSSCPSSDLTCISSSPSPNPNPMSAAAAAAAAPAHAATSASLSISPPTTFCSLQLFPAAVHEPTNRSNTTNTSSTPPGPASSPAVVSPGMLLGKRRAPGADSSLATAATAAAATAATAAATAPADRHHLPDVAPSLAHPQHHPQHQLSARPQPLHSCAAMQPALAHQYHSLHQQQLQQQQQQHPHPHHPAADVVHRLMLTLEELYSGCVKQLRLARRVYGSCNGTADASAANAGAAAGAAGAGGEGGTAAAAAAGVGCTAANGGGGGGGCTAGCTAAAAVLPGEAVSCRRVEELFRVVVQPGWKEGTRVTFPGKGNQLPCGSRGDMVLVVAQAAHTTFIRRGNDLHATVEVPLLQALTGGAAALTTLDGRRLELRLGPACLQPFSQRVVKGE